MYAGRFDAGRQLAPRLEKYRDRSPIVLGLPRGGVPVAYEVARALGAPLDVLIARKLGAPGQPELGIGAIAQGGAVYLNADLVRMIGVTKGYLDAISRKEMAEMERRLKAYRGDRPALDVAGRTVILVDDGLATGATMRAAVQALRGMGPREIILAVPVCAPETAEALKSEVEEVICAQVPEHFSAVGLWYEDFDQTTDEEVVSLLAQARRERAQTGVSTPPPIPTVAVMVPAGDVILDGDLGVPDGPRGVILFAHGSGSSRRSPRNRRVANYLRGAGFATLLLDLLTPEEEHLDARTRHLRFDISLLADRLVAVTDWLGRDPRTAALPVGYFGASTGGGAALMAAAERKDVVAAVVSRGGRPDLAGPALARVAAPTLLLVGGDDAPVIAYNRQAMAAMKGPVSLEIIPRATHLFEEPGALEEVARQAGQWFARHLGEARPGQETRRAEGAGEARHAG